MRLLILLPLLYIFFCINSILANNLSYTVISSFNLEIENKNPGVSKNIELVAQKLNKYKIAPGAVFSFNEIIGESSKEKGFDSARVIYKGELTESPGGGVCIISSGLFNLFLRSGFEIVERHKHSVPVQYVPSGLDATISYGSKDLKMKNPHSSPFLLEVNYKNGIILFSLKSDKNLDFKYEIFTDTEEDPYISKVEGTQFVAGATVSVYRKRWRGVNLVDNQLLYSDYIKAFFIESNAKEVGN